MSAYTGSYSREGLRVCWMKGIGCMEKRLSRSMDVSFIQEQKKKERKDEQHY